MSNRVGTARRKTRTKLKKPAHLRGKSNINTHLQVFANGEHVRLTIDPAHQKGMYHPKFHGRTGTVVGTRGRCFLVEVIDGSKTKRLLAHPAHLRRST